MLTMCRTHYYIYLNDIFRIKKLRVILNWSLKYVSIFRQFKVLMDYWFYDEFCDICIIYQGHEP
jgi:hypothetical protein